MARKILGMFVLVLSGGLSGQNLLVWDAWVPWEGVLTQVKELVVTPQDVSFRPYALNGGTDCGVEQGITVPEDGLYQLHFEGQGGGPSYFFSANWKVQGIEGSSFVSGPMQKTFTFPLRAGFANVRFDTNGSSLTSVPWMFEQPVLRKVSGPTVDVELIGSGYWFPKATFTSPAEVLLIAPSSMPPVAVMGFCGGLELAPMNAVHVLGATQYPPLMVSVGTIFRSSFLEGISWPSFALQAVSLSEPCFGSSLTVNAWSF